MVGGEYMWNRGGFEHLIIDEALWSELEVEILGELVSEQSGAGGLIGGTAESA
jgi:hypothetical protein